MKRYCHKCCAPGRSLCSICGHYAQVLWTYHNIENEQTCKKKHCITTMATLRTLRGQRDIEEEVKIVRSILDRTRGCKHRTLYFGQDEGM